MMQGHKDVMKYSLVFVAFFVYNILLRKIMEDEQPEIEMCPYCGIMTDNCCDSPPPDYCEQAIGKVYGLNND